MSKYETDKKILSKYGNICITKIMMTTLLSVIQVFCSCHCGSTLYQSELHSNFISNNLVICTYHCNDMKIILYNLMEHYFRISLNAIKLY